MASFDDVSYTDDIPDHLLGGLERYLEYGDRPGDFLRAVLENDLRGAFQFGDQASREALDSLVLLLENHVRSDCWGSPETVEQWMRQKREES